MDFLKSHLYCTLTCQPANLRTSHACWPRTYGYILLRTVFLLNVYIPACKHLFRYTSSARTSRGRKFQRKNTISQRKNLPIECAQGDRPARCPNHFFAVNEPSADPWWWCDLFWCHEVACGVRWSNVLGCAVTWGELLWLVATWHVMSCHLMCWSCHLMRCDCLCCVMSRDAMRCHVMCAHVKSCHLLCPAMGWNVVKLNRRYSLNNYSVLQSTTPVLLQHYSVLQSTTPTLLCTSKYYSSTTPVLLQHYSNTTLYHKVLLQYYKILLQYYNVLLCTAKYDSSTTKYYSSTTTYYSVLQSTTPVLQSTTPVLQSTTPVLQRTTLYYKVLLLYYKVLLQYYSVLLQYYSVLQSTTPVLLWNVISNARSKKSHPPTSPNTAPATQNESHDWSASHMNGHLQCVEQQESPSNFTKYCACHAKKLSSVIRVTYETSFPTRRAARVTLQLHQILRLPRKMNVMIDPAHVWNVIYNARSNRHHPHTSPNTAPATQNECHDWSCSHVKRHFQCAEQQESPSNFTNYCACHAKWMSWLILLTYETSFTMRGATGITLQPHQILRLPRKIALPNLREIYWKQLKWHFQCATDPSMIRAWSDPENANRNPPRHRGYFSHSPGADSIENQTFPAPAIIPNFTTCCTCHEKWHMNFTKCCACHEKWHMNSTKCFAYHEKWHMNFTKCCACHEKWHEVTHDYYYYYSYYYYYYYYLLLPTTTYYYLLLPTTTYYYLLLLLPTTTTYYYYLLLLPTTTTYYYYLLLLPTTTTYYYYLLLLPTTTTYYYYLLLLPTTTTTTTTYYLLPTTYYLLPTTYYLLPTTYYLLPTTYYLLPTTYYLLPTTYELPTNYLRTTYELPTNYLRTTYELPTNYLRTTSYFLLPTSY